jgi:peptidoglycan/LPS O-acetylase OafA/YrhL
MNLRTLIFEARRPTASTWALLAFLRWVMAFNVMLFHLRGSFGRKIPLLGGKASVIGFFLISGFSIAHSYQEKPQGYLRRRFLRIAPMYTAAVLFAYFVVEWIVPPPAYAEMGVVYTGAGFFTFLANLFCLQDFAAVPLSYDGPLWSLSIEVFYYLFAPALFRCPRAVPLVLTVGSMALFGMSPGVYDFGGYMAGIFAWPWLVGFLLGQKGVNLTLPIGLGLLGAALIVFNRAYTPEALSVFTYATVFGLIIAGPHVHLPAIVRTIANFLGDLSYPLYLLHLPLAILLYFRFGVRGYPALVSGIILLVIPMWWIFDEKLKRWVWMPVVKRILDLARIPSGSSAVPRAPAPVAER